MDHTDNIDDNDTNDTTVGKGCGQVGCVCTYCNNDNYDRYISDHLRQMLDEINSVLPEPVLSDHDQIKGDEELFYKVIMRVTRSILDPN